MNETVIEAQARYLIENRVRPSRRATATTAHRRHHRFPRVRWR
jgi:hypothetical protein